ncbi:ABC transporter ATP-binding protein [Sulfolobus sp. S-194]|uniref:ABC transporter ATP-binding protein n=1 Tax=Sulfolobus sp. S-194 TaxID=2512240 RepID=UPI00143702E2|nr:ABC transporter ATP-binding protein [Sulfolobus sp. S-194]QIW22722.1 ABC transporter ATP-binding protein [Sulfolobus sp. S-194]
MTKLLLKVQDLSVSYFVNKHEIVALKGVSLEIEKGEILGIIGESGSGKTTLAKAIIRSIKPPGKITKGKILYEGEDILSVDIKRFKREYLWKKISYVPQASQNSLNGVMRVIDHFYDTAISHGITGKNIIYNKAKEAVKMVSLDERVLSSYPHELSGGMKQRVLIALSLLLDPEVIILDEPTSALDVATQKSILDLVIKITKELGTTIILITHDIAVANYIAKKILVLYAGRVMEFGNTEEIMNHPLHPYTQGLINSVPSIYKDISKLKPINEGEIPLKGCPFHTRCSYVSEICKVEEPSLYTVNTRLVRCFLYDKTRKNIS